MKKIGIPKGMRDFSPQVMAKRNYIFDVLKKAFLLYGFEQIETPAMENRETLTGKYGEEGDRLIFNVINSGDYLKKVKDIDELGYDDFTFFVFHIRSVLWLIVKGEFELNEITEQDGINSDYISYVENKKLAIKFLIDNKKSLSSHLEKAINEYQSDPDKKLENSRHFNTAIKVNVIPLILSYVRRYDEFSFSRVQLNQYVNSISEKALRYDLTVPFARYVVQHQHEISFPFKRFQIQPVWRADRPQKGRYREFYQCDADIIGSDSLLNEVELIKLFDEVLSSLGLTDFSIKINNRKILTGIAELIGKPEMIVPITVAIDKLEKIGLEKVKAELTEKGLTSNELETIQPLFEIKGSTEEILSQLKDFLSSSEIAQQGIEELESMLSSLNQLQLKKAKVEVDVTLARGLDYYTGAIFEVVSNQVQMGSICGGGRYADLTGIFGLPNTSGVGVSFGADRIFDVMEELNLFPEALSSATQVLFVNFGAKEAAYCLPILERLRDEGIAAELYPDSAKLKKQLKYADQKQIPAVIMVGEDEMQSGILSLKNMISGEQQKLTVDELLKQLKAEVKN